MAAPASLESQATLAIQRQQLQRMSAEEVLVAFHDRDRLLRNAMKRLAELEVRQALMDPGAEARLLLRQQGWAARCSMAWRSIVRLCLRR